jgi:hypothetical protein
LLEVEVSVSYTLHKIACARSAEEKHIMTTEMLLSLLVFLVGIYFYGLLMRRRRRRRETAAKPY